MRYLAISSCVYCRYGKLGPHEEGKPFIYHICCYDEDNPREVPNNFEIRLPAWCPLPTLWELLEHLLDR